MNAPDRGMNFDDTIAAIATAMQPAGLGVIRVSGRDAANCVKSLFVDDSGKSGILHIPERQLVHGWIQDQDQIDTFNITIKDWVLLHLETYLP